MPNSSSSALTWKRSTYMCLFRANSLTLTACEAQPLLSVWGGGGLTEFTERGHGTSWDGARDTHRQLVGPADVLGLLVGIPVKREGVPAEDGLHGAQGRFPVGVPSREEEDEARRIRITER